jgi:hypothetical protein
LGGWAIGSTRNRGKDSAEKISEKTKRKREVGVLTAIVVLQARLAMREGCAIETGALAWTTSITSGENRKDFLCQAVWQPEQVWVQVVIVIQGGEKKEERERYSLKSVGIGMLVLFAQKESLVGKWNYSD